MYEITCNELMDIIKTYGRHKNKVWFYNSTERKKVLVEYDNTRRYFMSHINDDIMHRISADTFKSNIEYLTAHNYFICF